jgi:hypothetical protein
MSERKGRAVIQLRLSGRFSLPVALQPGVTKASTRGVSHVDLINMGYSPGTGRGATAVARGFWQCNLLKL